MEYFSHCNDEKMQNQIKIFWSGRTIIVACGEQNGT